MVDLQYLKMTWFRKICQTLAIILFYSVDIKKVAIDIFVTFLINLLSEENCVRRSWSPGLYSNVEDEVFQDVWKESP